MHFDTHGLIGGYAAQDDWLGAAVDREIGSGRRLWIGI